MAKGKVSEFTKETTFHGLNTSLMEKQKLLEGEYKSF